MFQHPTRGPFHSPLGLEQPTIWCRRHVPHVSRTPSIDEMRSLSTSFLLSQRTKVHRLARSVIGDVTYLKRKMEDIERPHNLFYINADLKDIYWPEKWNKIRTKYLTRNRSSVFLWELRNQRVLDVSSTYTVCTC